MTDSLPPVLMLNAWSVAHVCLHQDRGHIMIAACANYMSTINVHNTLQQLRGSTYSIVYVHRPEVLQAVIKKGKAVCSISHSLRSRWTRAVLTMRTSGSSPPRSTSS